MINHYLLFHRRHMHNVAATKATLIRTKRQPTISIDSTALLPTTAMASPSTSTISSMVCTCWADSTSSWSVDVTESNISILHHQVRVTYNILLFHSIKNISDIMCMSSFIYSMMYTIKTKLILINSWSYILVFI